MIRDRLFHEKEINVFIQVTETEGKDAFEVAGRGEFQWGVLIEPMRREGFELSISRPCVLYKIDETTKECLEPLEQLQVDVVVEKISLRKGELLDMHPIDG